MRFFEDPILRAACIGAPIYLREKGLTEDFWNWLEQRAQAVQDPVVKEVKESVVVSLPTDRKRLRLKFRCECGNRRDIYTVYDNVRYDAVIEVNPPKIVCVGNSIPFSRPDGHYCSSCNKFLNDSFSRLMHELWES